MTGRVPDVELSLGVEEGDASTSPRQIFRIWLAGPSGAGCSSLLRRIRRDEFLEGTRSSLRSRDNSKTVYEVQMHTKQHVTLEFCDELDIESKDCAGIVISYDITSKHSFEEAKRLILKTKKRKFLAGGAEEEDTAVIALVGCKCDLVSQRAVQYNEALAYATVARVSLFLETSSKTATNVTGLCSLLAQRLLQSPPNTASQTNCSPNRVSTGSTLLLLNASGTPPQNSHVYESRIEREGTRSERSQSSVNKLVEKARSSAKRQSITSKKSKKQKDESFCRCF